MPKTILAYDLGTGGNKASLYDVDGRCLAAVFVPYETKYPQPDWHEQRPNDWWRAVVQSTHRLLADGRTDPAGIQCLAISGHSLGCVPLDADGRLLRDWTPIWSDKRPADQVAEFFARVDPAPWYRRTGNGFPAPHYTVFKIMWYRDHEPELFRRTDKIIGTKDFINFKLTGRVRTDYSYASGSGVYDLTGWDYSDELIAAAGLSRKLFPEIVPSTHILGELTAEAAGQLGLPQSIQVAAGGVDNSCMALGARNIAEGRVYASLGSSSWVAVSSDKPLLDERAKPYVFAHVMPGMFTSAVGVFSTGTSFRWVRDQVCARLAAAAESDGRNAYELMTALAEQSPVGARKLLFNPSLAGGSSLEASPNIRGAFLGLDLGHNQADLIRAAMEGIALNLRMAIDELRGLCQVCDEMVVVGGGSQSRFWRQIYADAMDVTVVKTNVGQEAGSLGAAAVAAVGAGLWDDFSRIDRVHQVEDVTRPVPQNREAYEKLLPIFRHAGQCQARIGDRLAELDLSTAEGRIR
ncbi:MAG: FGGY-family carbohydrate kinase [Pirellulales bacterium]|nr:FGGY-family carbohydrate kinase [Pirellulales bacterium]